MIQLKQTDKTENTVTFCVSGISGDRQTYIWLWQLSQDRKWVTLYDARSLGYIKDYTVQSDSITVTFHDVDVYTYKVWDFYCADLADGSVQATSSVLHTLLAFSYEGASQKVAGCAIDITPNDILHLNRFASCVNAALLADTGITLYDDTFFSHKEVLQAAYVRRAAEVFYRAAKKANETVLPAKRQIMNLAYGISAIDSGSAVTAVVFNDFLTIVQMWKMRSEG